MARLLALASTICALLFAAGAVSAPREAPSSRGLILFWSDSPWPSIWSVRPDGSRLHRILRTSANGKRPSLSPDRQWVAFDGTPPGQRPLTNFDIQVVRLNGEDQRTVVDSRPLTEVDAQWSPDGSRLSFSRWESTSDWQTSEVWTVRPDGSELTRIAAGVSARWSPDGLQLAFQSPADESGDVSLMNAGGTGVRQLMATPELEWPAAWSPDGQEILFTRSEGPGQADVFVMDADGTSVRRLTRAPGAQIAAAWSPDGSKILYTSGRRPGHAQLFVMNADGSRKRSISRNRFSGSEPSWR